MNLKIKEGQKYKVLIECHHFPDDNEDDEGGFVMFSGEVYDVKYVFEKNGIVKVDLVKDTNQHGEKISRTVSLPLFLHCFEEIKH